MKTQNGEFIELVWPDGNDEGELFIRGHFDDEQTRQILIEASDELNQIATDAFLDNPKPPSDQQVLEQAQSLLGSARIERMYARWSTEADMETDITLRPHHERGRGRFPVTRAMLWPRLPCSLINIQQSGHYECRQCGRTMRGPEKATTLNGPVDCQYRRGDEPGPFTQIHTG